MPVYDVTLTAPNGNRVSAPIVADTADEAITDMEIRHDVSDGDPGFSIVAKERADPDGRLEASLKAAEMRALEAEFYRMPAPRRRVRR